MFQYKLNLNIQKHRCKIFFVSRLESWGEKEEVQWARRVELSITWLILILCPAQDRPRVKTLVISQHLSASRLIRAREIIRPVSYSQACWLAVLRVIEWDVVLNTHYGLCITGLPHSNNTNIKPKYSEKREIKRKMYISFPEIPKFIPFWIF